MEQILRLPQKVFKKGCGRIFIESVLPVPPEALRFRVIPANDFRVIRKNEEETCPWAPAAAAEGGIWVECRMDQEQDYLIKAYSAKTGRLVLEDAVYCLEEDLYALRPVLGDFHTHTTCSDGREAPPIVAANYCGEGFELLAITDHYTLEGSVRAIEHFQGCELPLTLLYGEEVQASQKNHVIGFGSPHSVNTRYQKDPEAFEREVDKAESTLQVPAGVNRREVAAHLVISRMLKEAGAFSVLAHPFWKPITLHMDPDTAAYILREGIYDAFELLGGMGIGENGLQLALWHDLTAEGVRIPFVSSSDSHCSTSNKDFNNRRTILFTAGKTFEQAAGAIRGGRTAAVYQYPGEAPRAFGTLRHVRYANFLLQHYFPFLAELMQPCARLMRQPELPEKSLFEAETAKVEAFYREFFGREEEHL